MAGYVLIISAVLNIEPTFAEKLACTKVETDDTHTLLGFETYEKAMKAQLFFKEYPRALSLELMQKINLPRSDA